MVKVVVLKPEEIRNQDHLLGTWLDESHYHTLIEEDMDLYLPPSCSTDFMGGDNCGKACNTCDNGLNEKNIVLKFRKNYFTQAEVNSAYAGLRDAAVETQNRGQAGGPRTEKCAGREWVTDEQFDLLEYFAFDNTNSVFGDSDSAGEVEKIRSKYKLLKNEGGRGVVWLTEKVKASNFKFNEFIDSLCLLSIKEAQVEASKILETYISKTTYANVVNSGISGSFSRYPRIPYLRVTTYTRDNPEKFKLAYPFLQNLAIGFKELLPWRYSNQLVVANQIDQHFRVPETPFTTVTVNRNFRTAAHYDAKNMENGMANLCVISNNDKFTGGYLVFPEIGYAVNVRPRDLLLVLNTVGLHGNTPIVLEDPDAERVSLIAYTHEAMVEGGSYEYEDTRREFVDSRRLNLEHPEQRNRWNGISPGMFCDNESNNPKLAKEWYDFLKSKGDSGDLWLDQHHPWLRKSYESNGIEDFI